MQLTCSRPARFVLIPAQAKVGTKQDEKPVEQHPDIQPPTSAQIDLSTIYLGTKSPFQGRKNTYKSMGPNAMFSLKKLTKSYGATDR
jgi:hypothetical protein